MVRRAGSDDAVNPRGYRPLLHKVIAARGSSSCVQVRAAGGMQGLSLPRKPLLTRLFVRSEGGAELLGWGGFV